MSGLFGMKTGKKKTSLEVHADELEIENTDLKVSDKKKRREQDKEEGVIDKVMPKKNKKKQKKWFCTTDCSSNLLAFWYHDFNIEITKMDGNETHEFKFIIGLYLSILKLNQKNIKNMSQLKVK